MRMKFSAHTGVAARSDGENAQERCGGRTGQQAGAHGLGGAAAREEFLYRHRGGVIRNWLAAHAHALIDLRCLRVVESEMA